MKNFNLKKINSIIIITSLVLSSICSFGILYLYCNQKSEKTLKLIHSFWLQSFSPYERILKNSDWSVERYEFFTSENKGVLKPNDLDIVQSMMLQQVYGIDHDYFILRSFNKKVHIEIRNGGITHDTSLVKIDGEDEFINLPAGIHYRSCEINSETFLCILAFSPPRNFIPHSESNYTFFTIKPDDLILSTRNVFWPFGSLDLQPIINFNLGSKTFSINQKDEHRRYVFERGLQVDSGFTIESQFLFTDILIWTSLISFIIESLFLFILFTISKLIAKKISNDANASLIKGKLENYAEIQNLIQGVVHDIKSPISALNTFKLDTLREDERFLFIQAIKRLRMIISDLEKRRTLGTKLSGRALIPLFQVLKLVIKEKQKEYGARLECIVDFPEEEKWIFASLSDFQRMLSNIINNSVEASDAKALIYFLWANNSSDQGTLIIRDKGRGIAPENLSLVFEKGISEGKSSGTGHGLYHARELILSYKGHISISSQVGIGTELSITLPLQPKPEWAITKLNLKNISTIVIVDDEAIYQNIWRKKLEPTGISIEIFTHPQDVPPDLFKKNNTFFIFDNNFGHQLGVGVQYCQMTNLDNCVLATSDWNLNEFQKAASKLGIRLVAKDFIPDLIIS